MLTLKQNQLLNYIIFRIEKNGVSPSYEEICKELELKSKSGIHRIVKSLEERGYIERLENKARAISPKKYPNGQSYNSDVINFKDRFINKHLNSITENIKSEIDQIPLLGKIAAGSQIEAISNYGEYLDVNSLLLSSEDCYALHVEGDSMVDEGIFDGDT
ncbi:MAG: S24 family peptidase, partial [Alphaproteobacteria bacterium]|nr:S24 family peptidase [Alphaproteobacteria bacterium]